MILLLSSFTLVMMGCRQDNECGNQHLHSEQDLKPISIKVVMVNMFEIGEDEDDKAGEFQLWKTGQKLDTCLPFKLEKSKLSLSLLDLGTLVQELPSDLPTIQPLEKMVLTN